MTITLILLKNPSKVKDISGIFLYKTKTFGTDAVVVFLREIWNETKNFSKFKNRFIDVLAHEYCHKVMYDEKMKSLPSINEHYGVYEMHIHDGTRAIQKKHYEEYLRLKRKFEKLKKENIKLVSILAEKERNTLKAKGSNT